MDDLGFLRAGNLVGHVVKILEDAGKIALEWGSSNAVSYDISKTEVTLFSKSKPQKLASQLSETTFHFGGQAIALSKEATRWLGIWLDSRLKFHARFNERIKRAKTAEARIKSLCKVYIVQPW